VLDEYTREALTIHYARSLTAGDIVQVLQRLVVQLGVSVYVKSDPGPEFIAQRVTRGCASSMSIRISLTLGVRSRTGVTRALMGYFAMAVFIASYLRRSRQPGASSPWLEEYNHERPHSAIDGLTPHAFAAQYSYRSLGNAA
jgi:putative transposase